MNCPRLRRWFAGGLIAVLLFVQWAVASYACPLPAGGAGSAAAMPADMPCAETMARGLMVDDRAPGLCAAHCKAGPQGLEPTHWPTLAMPAQLPTFTLPAAPPEHVATWTAIEPRRDRGPPPAHTVVHCCYRL